MTSRRDLLGFGLMGIGGLATGRMALAEEERTPGQPVLTPAYGQPSPHEAGSARIFTWAMDAKSVITRPSGGQTLTGGAGLRQITGLAWSGRGKITGVEVSTDGGQNWQRARLQEPVLAKCLTRFSLPWDWRGEPAILQSRAVDETGYRQPTREQLIAVRGTHGAYHNNAIQSWRVDPSGKVSNTHA